jgi:hypothetical protein
MEQENVSQHECQCKRPCHKIVKMFVILLLVVSIGLAGVSFWMVSELKTQFNVFKFQSTGELDKVKDVVEDELDELGLEIDKSGNEQLKYISEAEMDEVLNKIEDEFDRLEDEIENLNN